MDAAILEAQARPGREIPGRAGHERLLAVRQRTDSRPDVNGDPADVATSELDFAGVHSGAYQDAEFSRRVLNVQTAADRSGWAIEGRKEPIARGIHLAAAERGEFPAHERVMPVPQFDPRPVTHAGEGRSIPRCR